MSICNLCYDKPIDISNKSNLCTECNFLLGKHDRTFKCEFCEIEFIRNTYHNKPARFCTKSCSNSFRHKTGNLRNCMNDKSTFEHWVLRYGIEAAIQKKKELSLKISNNTKGNKNPMYGRNDHTHGIVKRNKACKGKKIEEIYGNARAEEIKQKLSNKLSGKNNPAYGKVYKSAVIS